MKLAEQAAAGGVSSLCVRACLKNGRDGCPSRPGGRGSLQETGGIPESQPSPAEPLGTTVPAKEIFRQALRR